MQSKQLFLPGLNRKTKENAHGGDHTKGKRKTARPFDPKQALHVVLRSSKARGRFSMLHPKHCNHVHNLVHRLKKRWNISVYRYANVGNHLHLLIRAKTRSAWQGFIRELSGGIAMLVTGARKGSPLKRMARQSSALKHATKQRAVLKYTTKQRSVLPPSTNTNLSESAQRGFWDRLVYTRIVSFGRDFNQVARYVLTNLWEGCGVPVRKFLAKGFRILEISETGGIFVHSRADAELVEALKPG